MLRFIAFLVAFASLVQAQSTSNDTFNFDPYLKYRPEFARSLPIQILLAGIALTLVSVLLIHLIFTGQYHYPLAPVNYILQLSGVTSLLITLIATLHIVLSETINESQQWPYMLSYIAVSTPTGTVGSITARAIWAVMTAATSGLIQITHIQFLTILYPSRLEARLISCLLVPLSVISVAMQLLVVNNVNLHYIASSVRNVCNATLALLFSASLFIWGFLINRKRAWRCDGGTAAFGVAALTLALVSTALNFLYVPREEEYLWLPGLMWAVVLWQSFLGWWWWVGAGSGSMLDGLDEKAQLEEFILRGEKRERRRRARFEKRRETREKAKKALRGVADAFTGQGSTAQRRKGPNTLRSSSLRSGPEIADAPPESRPSTALRSSASSAISTNDAYPRLIPKFVYRGYDILRHAHRAAAHVQNVERAERIRVMERGGVLSTPSDPSALMNFGRRIGLTSKTRSEDPSVKAYSLEEWKVSDVNTQGPGGVPVVNKSAMGGHYVDTSWSVGRTISWWGPLRRWRLQNQTVYS